MAEENTPTPDRRPQPQYGELAPEGWSWKPEDDKNAPAGSPDAGPSANERRVPTPQGQVSGVPHNLGVGAPPLSHQPSTGQPADRDASAQPNSSTQSDGAGSEQSYRGTPPPGAQAPQSGAGQQPPAGPGQLPQATPYSTQAPQYTYGGSGMPGAPQRKDRQADRIITIILLAIGALGALYTALAIYQMAASFNLIASVVGIEDFTVPAAIDTISTIGALVILALYAVTLIFSIQRLRARKLTFWVPLSAGVLAVILFFVFTFIAAAQMPELMEHLADPSTAAKLLDGTFS